MSKVRILIFIQRIHVNDFVAVLYIQSSDHTMFEPRREKIIL